jgi:hypothetical protein
MPLKGCSPVPFIGGQTLGPGTFAAQCEQAPPFFNMVKHFANWNVCYSCGFDVTDSHNSMSCPTHLQKATHDIYFTHENAAQYIDLGHPCSMRNRHKVTFLAM